MQAFILAGGQGARLRPYTTVLPKPLMPLEGIPTLERLLNHLHTCRVNRVWISVYYMGRLIEGYFRDGGKIPPGMEVTFIHEKGLIGTASPLSSMPPWEGPLLMMNADLLTNVDVGRLVAHHEATRSALTISVQPYQHKLRYGALKFDDDGNVLSYLEKPTVPYWINRGIYVVDPSVQRFVRPEDMEIPELMECLRQAGERVTVCTGSQDEYWFDIGDEASLQVACEHLRELDDREDSKVCL